MAICVRGNFRGGHFCHANLVTEFYDSSLTNYIFVPFLYIWGKALSRTSIPLRGWRKGRIKAPYTIQPVSAPWLNYNS